MARSSCKTFRRLYLYPDSVLDSLAVSTADCGGRNDSLSTRLASIYHSRGRYVNSIEVGDLMLHQLGRKSSNCKDARL